LLVNDDPELVQPLLADLSPAILKELQALNPAVHDLSRMIARVIILHGKNDNMIPYTESLALSQALPREKVHLFILDGLFHVDIRPHSDDVPRLLQAVNVLLEQRRAE
jgi:esterase/lipase